MKAPPTKGVHKLIAFALAFVVTAGRGIAYSNAKACDLGKKFVEDAKEAGILPEEEDLR